MHHGREVIQVSSCDRCQSQCDRKLRTERRLMRARAAEVAAAKARRTDEAVAKFIEEHPAMSQFAHSLYVISLAARVIEQEILELEV